MTTRSAHEILSKIMQSVTFGTAAQRGKEYETGNCIISMQGESGRRLHGGMNGLTGQLCTL